ncbi:MAG: aspartate kinase [Candidatus Delongbacteria bacterium]|jgi:aspartate kinase|nr:aspartate kinase [Candidatus Delongbacteria bacterium]
MALIVQKYGGSSLASPEKIRSIAERIVERFDSGDKLVIVVSATGDTTDRLRSKAFDLSGNPDHRELDMLVSIGERESISLMSIAINSIKPGLAQSFTGSQIGLITDCNHQNARILEIKGDRLKQSLEENHIPIIAGFQGVSTKKEITTLGRGGSDTTAVAVTVALCADYCEIYSDVAGVHTTDPKIVPDAKLIKELNYNTMLEISSSGAKVLKNSAVEYAKRLNIKISTGHSSTGYIGTIISNDILNKNKYTALVYNDKLFYSIHENEDFFSTDISQIKLLQSFENKRIKITENVQTNSKPCYSLTIIGNGIKTDSELLKKMYDMIVKSNEIVATELSDLKFSVYLKKPLDQAVIDTIHSLFFD